MKLLMITGDRALAAGKQGAFHNTLEELHKHFDRIDVVCPNPGIRRYDMQVFGNVHVHPSPWPLIFQPLWIFWKGRRILKAQSSQLMTVHSYSPFYNDMGAWLLGRITRTPYVLEVHHIPGYPRSASIKESLYRSLSRYLLPVFARRARAVRTVNARQAPEFLRAAGVPADRIVVSPSVYLDTDTFKPTDASKQYDIIFVGRMARNKGIDLFLDILERTGLVGIAVGDGPLLSWVRSQAKRRGLKLHTPGFLPDAVAVAAALNQSRLAVMTSYNEGGPRVVIEALACGVPVVATPVGIVPDVLPPEAIEEWDSAALADKVRNILADTELYARLRSSGLQAVVPFERRVVITAYADTLKKLIA